jgi:hypothetical protein
MMKSLPDQFNDWAAYSLGVSLGLIPDEPAFGGAKHVFWSNHPTGEILHAMLDRLVEHGVLEKRDEPDIQYRWSSAFHGTWD